MGETGSTGGQGNHPPLRCKPCSQRKADSSRSETRQITDNLSDAAALTAKRSFACLNVRTRATQMSVGRTSVQHRHVRFYRVRKPQLSFPRQRLRLQHPPGHAHAKALLIPRLRQYKTECPGQRLATEIVFRVQLDRGSDGSSRRSLSEPVAHVLGRSRRNRTHQGIGCRTVPERRVRRSRAVENPGPPGALKDAPALSRVKSPVFTTRNVTQRLDRS